MVEAGEAAGILDQVLDRVAFQIEKETKIKRRVKGAMIYPTMVLIFATLVLIGMLMFLVPVFVDIFADLGGDLPTLTASVVKLSDFLRGNCYFVFPALFAAGFGFRKFKRTELGRASGTGSSSSIPMKIGQVVLKVTLARFSRTLSTLIAAGVTSSRRSRSPARRRQLGRRVGARGRARSGARGCADRDAAVRERGVPADGLAHGQDR